MWGQGNPVPVHSGLPTSVSAGRWGSGADRGSLAIKRTRCEAPSPPPLKGRQAPLGRAPPARGPLRPTPSWGTPWPRGSCTSPDRHGGQSRQRTGWDCPAGPGLLLHSPVWGPRDRRALGQSSAAPQWLSPGQQVGLAVTHPRPQLVRWGFVPYYTTGLLSTWPSPGETTLARWLRTAPCWRG